MPRSYWYSKSRWIELYNALFLLQRSELAACRSGGGRRVVKTEGRPGLQPRPRGMRPWPAQQPIHVLPLHMDVTSAPPSHAPAPPSTRLPSWGCWDWRSRYHTIAASSVTSKISVKQQLKYSEQRLNCWDKGWQPSQSPAAGWLMLRKHFATWSR